MLCIRVRTLSALAASAFLALAFGASAIGDDEAPKPSAAFEAAAAKFRAGVKGKDEDLIFEGLDLLRPLDEFAMADLLVTLGLQHGDYLVHQESIEMLEGLKDDDARRRVVELAREAKKWELRATCLGIAAHHGGPRARQALVESLEDKQWQIRSAAVRGLAKFRTRTTADLLVDRLDKEQGRIRADLAWALEELTGEDFPANAELWRKWFASKGADWRLPTRREIEDRRRKGEARDIGTAVRDGLYGPIYSERVAFILDRSGSMTAGTETQGTRMAIAKRELIRVLTDQLGKRSTFNVIAYSSEVEKAHEKLVVAKKRYVKKTCEWIERLAASGETNTIGAIKAAFDDPAVDTIYLLSDGKPTLGQPVIPELIVKRVSDWNRSRRIVIHTIGFFPGDAKGQDKEEAREFLKRLAGENEGTYKEIY